MKSILISTEFEIGERVCSKLTEEDIYMVTGYLVPFVNTNGEAENTIIRCSNGCGETLYFFEYEMERTEVVT